MGRKVIKFWKLSQVFATYEFFYENMGNLFKYIDISSSLSRSLLHTKSQLEKFMHLLLTLDKSSDLLLALGQGSHEIPMLQCHQDMHFLVLLRHTI